MLDQRTIASALLACAAAVGPAAGAENIDPAGNGSQYAYAENTGWINAEPEGDGGSGVEVSDSSLTGYMWGENAGWISLSCDNDSSCATTAYGVTNDGLGGLAGFAWSENLGWISFSCANTGSCGAAEYGVRIDPLTGDFSGRAWGENVGWISFASDGPHPYRVSTSWTCLPPSPIPAVELERTAGLASIAWTPTADASSYDVVHGALASLRASGGDFSVATVGCAADDTAALSVPLPGDPPAGTGEWFLVRGANCGGGTYDETGAAPRDPGILASGQGCP